VNRFLLALVPLTMLTAVGWADRELRREEVRARQIAQNQTLIAALVDRGLGLADEDDPARRADQLGMLAETLASEIGQAARNSESGRVDELDAHLEKTRQEGLVESLEELREQAPPGSSLAQKLEKVKARTARTVKQLETELNAPTTGPAMRERLRRAIRTANNGHNAVVESAGKATAAER
jgi:hypothetical protein